MTIDCTKCGAHCCRMFPLIEVDPGELNGHIQVQPHAPGPVHLDEVYLLARRGGLLGPCVHLTDDNLCGIYAHRPWVCRAYDCAEDGNFYDVDDPAVETGRGA